MLVHLTQHEDASVAMFNHLIRVNDLQSSFDQYDITNTDLVFVREQIAGPIDTEQCSSQMQSVSSRYCVVVYITSVFMVDDIYSCRNFLGVQRGALCPLEIILLPEIGLKCTLVSSCTQQSVKVLPLYSFENFFLKPLQCTVACTP